MTQIGDVAADLAWLLGGGAIPWLLLLAILLVRPPVLSGLRAVMAASHDSRYQHLLNLTRFRTELVKRESRIRLARAGRTAPRDMFANAPWITPREIPREDPPRRVTPGDVPWYRTHP
jgi:hypothetical protein